MQEAWAKELAAEKASKQGIEKLLLRIKVRPITRQAGQAHAG